METLTFNKDEVESAVLIRCDRDVVRRIEFTDGSVREESLGDRLSAVRLNLAVWFADNPNRPVSHSEILLIGWPEEYTKAGLESVDGSFWDASCDSLYQMIRRLRLAVDFKIESNGRQEWALLNPVARPQKGDRRTSDYQYTPYGDDSTGTVAYNLTDEELELVNLYRDIRHSTDRSRLMDMVKFFAASVALESRDKETALRFLEELA